MTISLTTPVADLPRIGAVLTKRLGKLGLHTVHDLLHYYPFRYEDFSTISTIDSIKEGQQITVRGDVNLIANKRAYRRRMYVTDCLISDETGSIKVVWFNQPFITKILKQGDTAFFSGKAELTKYGLQLVGPTYEKIKKEQTHTARIVPIYSLTESLTEKQIRYLIKLVLPLAKDVFDWLPESIRTTNKLIDLHQALREVHFPTNKKTLVQARTRLKFDELFLVQLKTQSIRQQVKHDAALPITFDQKRTKEFVSALPFTLTDNQRKVSWEILQNLDQPYPMNRLLQGDVGSGKTVVATIAMVNTVANNAQAALMAPTEILAQQHYQTIRSIIPKSTSVALLTRSTKTLNDESVSQKKIIEAITKGEVDIVVGTHALIQEKVTFHKLGLVIIDEQHRFGVDQRKTLKLKSPEIKPHLLSMTATPIPRSLALTIYGDLDVSIITEMPHGRKKIITKVVAPDNRDKAYDFINKEIIKGRQVFVVCPLIDESDKLGVKAATAEYEKLNQEVFPDLKIGLLHGKLKAADKEAAMKSFADNSTKILVATAVVEVGIDIPNASVMMIEGAERFGLAQLHQFRGRVGRAEHQSYCFVFTDSDSDKTIERLNALVTAANGFELAEKDLEFRGPGEIYGIRQSGFPDLKIATLADLAIIQQTKEAAIKLFDADASLDSFPLVKERLKVFSKNVHLE